MPSPPAAFLIEWWPPATWPAMPKWPLGPPAAVWCEPVPPATLIVLRTFLMFVWAILFVLHL
jgi:hypothetical protein